MGKRVYFLFLIVYILLSSFYRLNGQTYSDLYDLHFKIAKDTNTENFYPWRINAAHTYHSFYPSYRGNNVYTVRYDSTLASTKQLEFELEQRILLPTHNAKQGKVTFKGLGDNLKESYLVIEGLDYQEKTIFSDTLRMQLSTDHKTFSKDILFKDIELLNLRFHIEGEEKKNASIGFSRVEILIGNKSIDTFPIRKLANNIDLKEYLPINLNSSKAFDKIDVLKNKKIIGLGESIHRNTCINNLAYQFIEEQVKNEKCRLVLVERNIEKSLIYNRYVNGGNIEIENYVDSNYEDKYFLNFLDKIRKYNQGKKESEKVNIFGIDYNYFLDKDNNSFDDVFYYITAINNELRKKELDMLALTLIEGENDKALSFLYKNKEVLEAILPPKDYQTILHTLNLSYKIGDNKTERIIARDSVMYLNSNFFIRNFCAESSSTVIYAHSSHLNPISTYPALPSRPLGSFLKQEYSKDYFSLILLIGQGSLQVKDLALGLTNKDLSSPMQGSLEYQLNNLENNAVYYPTTSKLDELLLVRFIGNSACPTEFFPFNVSQRHDGILFLKECSDISTPESPSYNIFQQENINDSILDEYSKLLKEKYTERLEKSKAKKNNKIKLIKELKKRIENRTYD